MDSFNRVVANMMNRFGGEAQAIIPVEGQGAYNVETSEYETIPPMIYTIKVMVFDFTLQSNGTQTQPGSLIQAGDKQVFVQPLENMPKLKPNKDFILISDTKYKIVTYKELNPSQADNMLIELFVRA